MKLTEEQQQKVKKFFEDNMTSPCPICHGSDYTCCDSTLTLLDRLMGGPMLSVIPFTCSKCGYTSLFNSKVMGIKDPVESSAMRTWVQTIKSVGGEHTEEIED